MTVTVIRLDTKQGEGFTQYCIVNTEMNMREFKSYCQIYNVFDTKGFSPRFNDMPRSGIQGVTAPRTRAEFPAHIIRDSKWSDEAGAIKQFERWQAADDVYTTDNPTID